MSATSEELRERRRLKILGRSEERLKKVMGYSSTESERPRNLQRGAGDPLIGNSYHEAEADSIDTDCCIADDAARRHLLLNGPRANADPVSSYNLPSNERRLSDSSFSRRPVEVQDTEQPAGTAAYYTKRSVLMFVIGIIVRLSFFSYFGNAYVQTIFNPFFASELAIIGYERAAGMGWADHVSGGLGGMWLSVFQLLGIDPAVIQTYKRSLAMILLIVDDFAVFFFAFILIHVLL